MNNNSTSMPSWLKIATWLLLGSLATFSFKKPTLFWQNANINDVLLALSTLCFIIAWYKKQIRFALPKWSIVCIALIIATQLIGTFVSLFHFGVFAPDALREYSRIAAALIVAIEVYTIGVTIARFVRHALIALVLSSIILPIIFYLPAHALRFFLDESQTRFSGFLYDPNYFATLQLLPAFILLWFSFDRSAARSILMRGASFILFAYSVSSIIWSGSRGGVFGLVVGLGVLGLFFLWKLPFRRALALITLIIAGCMFAYVLAPRIGKHDIAARAQTIVAKTNSSSPIAHSLQKNRILKKVAAPVARISGQQGRFVIWQSAWGEFKKNPFGYGPDYGNNADIVGDNNDHHRVAHNTLFQMLLTGGIAFFGICIVALYVFLKRIIRYRGTLGEIHYLTASLIGIGAAALFLDSLWSRWIWITIALIAVLLHSKRPETQ
jgi:hypothetical protein